MNKAKPSISLFISQNQLLIVFFYWWSFLQCIPAPTFKLHFNKGQDNPVKEIEVNYCFFL